MIREVIWGERLGRAIWTFRFWRRRLGKPDARILPKIGRVWQLSAPSSCALFYKKQYWEERFWQARVSVLESESKLSPPFGLGVKSRLSLSAAHSLRPFR